MQELRMMRLTALAVLASLALRPQGPPEPGPIRLEKEARIVLLGGGPGARMIHFGHFETEIHLRHPDHRLVVRNMCDEGNTPSFRPHSARKNQLGFPGAEKFALRYGDGRLAPGEGFFPTEEEWLAQLKPDVLIAFFGFNESFQGMAGLEPFREELDAFVRHTLAQKYNGAAPPRLVLVSPTAIQDLSASMDVPDGKTHNPVLAAYASVLESVARAHGVRFIDAFHASQAWFRESKAPLTIDGVLLNDAGDRKLAEFLAERLFGPAPAAADRHRDRVRRAVLDKDWCWLNDFKIPNGVHAYGRRHNPYGPANYPFEIEKVRQMTALRDRAIWAALRGETLDVAALDAQTRPLPPVETNFKRPIKFLYGADALASLRTAPGYKVELWASEKEFPHLANPVQLSFDNRGRLWVAVMPSYPHWRPGDPLPDDKLLILEDTDGDGRADKETVFADRLHLPLGFELAPEGVYVSQGRDLVLLKDTDGDDRADVREVVLSGFDDHDTHHAISAFCADPSGAIFMCEGVFLRTSVETPYGPVRGTDGGFFRFDPRRRHLERHAQLSIPNPWGVAFDDWGQHFFLHTSGPNLEWMLPGSVRPRYGVATPASADLIEPAHRVRPTSGLEFVSSRHFPDEVQGDLLLNNAIGFLGTKQHRVSEEGTGYRLRWRQDLLVSSDPNFRPVDLEFAPDGSLFIVDWHNPLVGHMQHNARDPNRDHTHGRIYRITYPAKPLVPPAVIHGAPVARLLENLKLPEYRSRYRTRRELRGRKPEEVLPALTRWVADLRPSEAAYEHHLLEALWVTWGFNRVDEGLLRRLLESKDHRVRAAAVRVLRYNGHRLPDQTERLARAAADPHGRVRLEAIAAASWIGREAGLRVLEAVPPESASDPWIRDALRTARAHLRNEPAEDKPSVRVPDRLKGAARDLYVRGAEIYARDGHCGTCHQPDGQGLELSGFPPLAESPWVTSDEERLIKLTLHGMAGPIEVKGKVYPGLTPMTPFGGLLSDDEIAAVLTYVRNSFGNEAPPVSPARVREVREATRGRAGFYTAQELLDPAAAARTAAPPGRAFVRTWTMEDFKGAFDAPLRGRDFERGKRMFEVAGCAQCHNVRGEGAHVGADLSRAADEYPGAELLRQILEPSARIKDPYRVVRLLLKDGRRVTGMIVRREEETLHLAENLQEPGKTVAVRKADIERMVPSDLSPMPSGLLSILEREEILDLVAFIAAQGNPDHPAFRR
jgi:putative heme-binding domain-containing protein